MSIHRALTDWERQAIGRLLGPAFPGRDELRQQLDHVLGRPIDANGSLDLRCHAASAAPVVKRIPTEGEARDSDGTTIHYLLHVVAGKMNELEIFKDDSSRVMQHPDPKDIEVIMLG